MATLVNNSSGNFTTAATWSLVDATSLLDTESNTAGSTTTFQSSATFTPGAITIDALYLKVASRAANATGTVSVRLAIAGVPVLGSTVTINVQDLQGNSSSLVNNLSGWVPFKLAAPITLLSLTGYTFQMQTSVNTSLTVYRSATAADWSRMLRTTTTQAPSAGDNLNICGEYISAGSSNAFTVTMDNTSSTQFGKIETSSKGTLSCGTTSSTAYQLFQNGASSSFYVNGDGIVQFGTSGTPIPATSSMTLKQFQNGTTQTNGILLRGNGNFTTFGATKTQKAFLNLDANAAATTITTDISTGWNSADQLIVCSTTRTSAESELVTMSGNATGTSVPISALSFAHSGTGATKGEVANLTRNIKLQGETTSLASWINVGADALVNFNNSEIYFMGSATSNKRGIDVSTTNANGGSFTISGCVLRDFTNGATFGMLFNSASNANISVTNTNFYNLSTALALNSTTMTASTITINNILSISAALILNAQAATMTNITAVSTTISFGQVAVLTGLSINNIINHSSSAAGISISSHTLETLPMTNITAWRNTTRGIFFSIAANISLDGVTVFGNGTAGIECSNSNLLYFNNVTANAGTTLTQPVGISFSASGTQVYLTNSSFGTTTAHATGDLAAVTGRSWHDVYISNCLFNSTTEVSGSGNIVPNASFGSSKHDQTNAIHKMFKRYGLITADSSIVLSSPLSQRLTPSSATNKLISNNKSFSIPSSKTAKITVNVRRSVAGDGTAYNGNLPRLWLRSNNSAGISSDTLLATATVASLGAFEPLVGTIPAANDNTINYIYVDCDGTTGWINIDSWKLEIINGSANGNNTNSEDYWNDGAAFQSVNTTILKNSGEESYWSNGAPASELFPISAVQTGKFFLNF